MRDRHRRLTRIGAGVENVVAEDAVRASVAGGPATTCRWVVLA
jgi:hypothetical protein